MPGITLLDMPQQEQDQRLAVLRRACYGYLLALHVLPRRGEGRLANRHDQVAAEVFPGKVEAPGLS